MIGLFLSLAGFGIMMLSTTPNARTQTGSQWWFRVGLAAWLLGFVSW